MALDLYLQKDASIPKSSEDQLLSFKDDGYFWFLYPFFDVIAKKTDQLIELYDDAFFDGDDLNSFDEMIAQVRSELALKPDVWEEHIGTIIHKDVGKKPEKIYSTVQKSELIGLLVTLEKAVIKAKRKNTGIFFFGD